MRDAILSNVCTEGILMFYTPISMDILICSCLCQGFCQWVCLSDCARVCICVSFCVCVGLRVCLSLCVGVCVNVNGIMVGLLEHPHKHAYRAGRSTAIDQTLEKRAIHRKIVNWPHYAHKKSRHSRYARGNHLSQHRSRLSTVLACLESMKSWVFLWEDPD